MDRRGWTEVSLAAVLSLIMSMTGLLLLFFMLPLQVMAVRRGEKGFLISASGVLFGNLILKLALTPEAVTAGSLIIADFAVFLLLIGGLYAVNFKMGSFSKVWGFLIVTATAGLLSLPVLLYLGSDPAFLAVMTAQIESALAMLQQAFQGDAVVGSITAEGMFRIFKDSFLSSYLAVYCFFVALTWRLGLRIGLKSIGRENEQPKLQELNVPDRLVWFLFIPLTLVLLRMLLNGKGFDMDLGIAGFAVSNSLYIAGALYGLQGFGLLQFLMARKQVNPGVRRMTGWLLPLSLLIFPLNLAVIFLLPGLGVSELWINYRHNDKELVQ
ncbi:DUF2232 domain-containing protein [Spirochaeta isovalerica]|uniref:DUF2232 domain-containing protein n=1 Tax=Spirochaeta isovalerica TaxID=150 RepID=A0A841RBJ2_9SPIO|nr:DUF2232 domain-containing protein [Spirochaeta isovalerica]MBB6481303.1 hypothetical protein [Spirochaeta isovalerica]